MFDTGPGRGLRPSTCRSISSTYQRTPSSPRSTSAQASRHGLPISPDEQQREQVAVRGHHVDGGGHPLFALVQLDLAPVGVLVHRGSMAAAAVSRSTCGGP
jgi:hypothetical protein